MRKLILCFAAALSLNACATTGQHIEPGTPAPIVQTINGVEARFEAAKIVLDMVYPFLPVATAAKARAIVSAIEHGIVLARVAATRAEQRKALDQVRSDIERLQAVTGPGAAS